MASTNLYLCACLEINSVQLFVIPWTVAPKAPLSMGFSRQEDWSGLPFSSPGDHPDPGMEPSSHVFPALKADSLPTELSGFQFISFSSPQDPFDFLKDSLFRQVYKIEI